MASNSTQPGDLDQRVTIQSETRADDGYGGSTLAWSTVATVWAQVWPVSGKERVQAQQIEAPAMYRCKIRRRGDVTAGMRVVWRSVAYNIRFVADAGPREPYMVLDLEAGVAL
ncbi:MAG TPA: phage head closure protein [Azospirillum sp.]|nr:phage head closure protein [Azospirillum sp.]